MDSITSLEDVNDFSRQEHNINSPRSLEACRRIGIEPHQLNYLTFTDVAEWCEYLTPGINVELLDDVIKQQHSNFEQRRISYIAQARAERAKMIQAANTSDSSKGQPRNPDRTIIRKERKHTRMQMQRHQKELQKELISHIKRQQVEDKHRTKAETREARFKMETARRHAMIDARNKQRKRTKEAWTARVHQSRLIQEQQLLHKQKHIQKRDEQDRQHREAAKSARARMTAIRRDQQQAKLSHAMDNQHKLSFRRNQKRRQRELLVEQRQQAMEAAKKEKRLKDLQLKQEADRRVFAAKRATQAKIEEQRYIVEENKLVVAERLAQRQMQRTLELEERLERKRRGNARKQQHVKLNEQRIYHKRIQRLAHKQQQAAERSANKAKRDAEEAKQNLLKQKLMERDRLQERQRLKRMRAYKIAQLEQKQRNHAARLEEEKIRQEEARRKWKRVRSHQIQRRDEMKEIIDQIRLKGLQGKNPLHVGAALGLDPEVIQKSVASKPSFKAHMPRKEDRTQTDIVNEIKAAIMEYNREDEVRSLQDVLTGKPSKSGAQSVPGIAHESWTDRPVTATQQSESSGMLTQRPSSITPASQRYVLKMPYSNSKSNRTRLLYQRQQKSAHAVAEPFFVIKAPTKRQTGRS